MERISDCVEVNWISCQLVHGKVNEMQVIAINKRRHVLGFLVPFENV